MSTILVTGATGFVGAQLVKRLAATHEVITFSRRLRTVDMKGPAPEPVPSTTVVRGDFTSREDLEALDGLQIDAVVHLASEIGNCSEDAGLAVNVAGTRTLMRYLIDRGCTRFILASSVAAAGVLSENFVPERLPIPEDHPCLAVDAYGMTKALMEDVAQYFARKHAEIEVSLFRLGAVSIGVDIPVEAASSPYVLAGGEIAVEDAVEVFAAAVDRPLGPGARRFNLVAAESRTSMPVADALVTSCGESISHLDLSYFQQPGRERASLWATDRLVEVFGIRPRLPEAVGQP